MPGCNGLPGEHRSADMVQRLGNWPRQAGWAGPRPSGL
jgi:hypothetical protein